MVRKKISYRVCCEFFKGEFCVSYLYVVYFIFVVYNINIIIDFNICFELLGMYWGLSCICIWCNIFIYGDDFYW